MYTASSIIHGKSIVPTGPVSAGPIEGVGALVDSSVATCRRHLSCPNMLYSKGLSALALNSRDLQENVNNSGGLRICFLAT